MNIHEELKGWYWSFGVRRVGKYRLYPDGWLDRLYHADWIEKAVTSGRSARRAMEFWGTSQTGKSTLLSSYLDEPDDPEGNRSALTWPGGPKVRFCVAKRDQPPPDGTVVLNPWNSKSDASSCISRFRLAEEVDDPEHPVEIRLATSIQVMHALAMGYATECKQDRDGRRAIQFDLDDFNSELDRFQSRQVVTSANCRVSYELLHELADLLDLLILSDHPRYSALRLTGNSTVARQKLLDCHRFLDGPEAVEALAFTILWDSRERLNETYRRLVRWTEGRRAEWGDRPIYGSPRTVALLLDASSYSRLHLQDPEGRAKAEAEVRRLKAKVRDDRVVIGTAEGEALLPVLDDYALFQGNVLELVIPVRRAPVADHPDLVRFLDEADLLDFPGTGRAQGNVETRIDIDALAPGEVDQLFTRVLKRGKTASIVASYSRNLSIDGFSVLAKVMDPPGQPEQLTTGIATWWKEFKSEPGIAPTRTRSPLPLNLVMSFWGQFFKTTNVDAVLNGAMGQVLEPLRDLSRLADPDVITQTLAVNYPKLDEDHARLPPPSPALDSVVDAVMRRPEFRRQFATATAQDSFRAMIKDGGTDFLFQVVRDQVIASPRAGLLEALGREGSDRLQELFVEALPKADDSEKSRQALALWADRLEGTLADPTDVDAVEQVSLVLRTLLSVPTDKLDPVPIRLQDERQGEAGPYVQEQFLRWVEHAKDACRDKIGLLGLAGTDHAHLALHGLMEAVDQGGVNAWLVATLGHIKSRSEGRANLRYLAIRMANDLFPAVRSRPHRTPDEIVAEMDTYEDRDRYTRTESKDSPHYRQFLAPFIAYLRLLGKNLNPGGRPPQPGDDELKAIQLRYLTR
jgi:hypothetical protein